MERRTVSLKQTATELTLVPDGATQFETADTIYFSNVLPGDRLRNGSGYIFELDKLGSAGLSELRTYLEQHGYALKFDSTATTAFEKVAADRASLKKALQIGSNLRKHPQQRISILDLRRKLKPFQVPAVAHMVAVENSANFSVPGSGKTTIAIAAFAKIRSAGVVEKLVVIGPRASFAPWEKELAASLKPSIATLRITGSKSERANAWQRAKFATVVLLNYHVASNDRSSLRELLSATNSMLVLDESHHIKSISDSKWATAIRSIAPFAKRRVVLSGTPAPNSLLDLWSQFNFLYPETGLLGTREEFTFGLENDTANASKTIQKKVWPLFWRIRKRDLSLPRPRVHEISVKLGDVQAAIYNALAAKVLRDHRKAPAELEKLRAWRRARMIRLLQAASNPALLTKYSHEFRIPPLAATGLTVTELIDRYPDYEVPAKIATAVSLVKEVIGAKRKVIVWTSFVHNIKMLLRLLRDAGPLPLYGGIPLSEEEGVELNREGIINRFTSDPNSRILIANPAACAESISLHTSCHHAIYLDRTFNCAHFLQSKDRIHRIGLKATDDVNYYLLLASDTIDEVVDQRLRVKQERMLRLLETDFANVNLDLGEDVVSEESEEEIDFSETIRQIAKSVRNDQ